MFTKKPKTVEELALVINDYWSAIISGDIPLENGEKFSSSVFYNPKHLKVDITRISKAIMMAYLHKIKGTKKEKKWIEAAVVCAGFLANFARKGVKDKLSTGQNELGELAAKHTLNKPKPKTKDILKLAEEWAGLSKKSNPELFKNLIANQYNISKQMRAGLEKLKKKKK